MIQFLVLLLFFLPIILMVVVVLAEFFEDFSRKRRKKSKIPLDFADDQCIIEEVESADEKDGGIKYG